jgi:hypothetical protein
LRYVAKDVEPPRTDLYGAAPTRGEGWESRCEGWDAGAARDADEARQAVAVALFVEDAALVVGVQVRRVAPRRPPHLRV